MDSAQSVHDTFGSVYLREITCDKAWHPYCHQAQIMNYPMLDRCLLGARPFVDLENLSIADLVATVLGGRPPPPSPLGCHGALYKSAVDLLDALGGLTGLSRAGVDEIASCLGRSMRAAGSRAHALGAAFELGRRVAEEPPLTRPVVRGSRDIAAWGMARIGGLDHEELWLIAVDGQSRFRAARRVAQGGVHGMALRPYDPLRHALRVAASGFCLLHNHPSGDPTPSEADVMFTKNVAQAAAAVWVPLLDHVVVTRDSYASVRIAPAL